MLHQPYQREADEVADKYNHEKAYCLLLFASMDKNYATKEIGIHRLSTAYPPDND